MELKTNLEKSKIDNTDITESEFLNDVPKLASLEKVETEKKKVSKLDVLKSKFGIGKSVSTLDKSNKPNLLKKVSLKISSFFSKLTGEYFKYCVAFLISLIFGFILFGYAYYWFYDEYLFHLAVGDFMQGVDFNYYLGLVLFLFGILLTGNLILSFIFYKHKKFEIKTLGVFNISVLLVIIIIFLGSYVFRNPQIIENYPGYNDSLLDYSKPLYVRFAVPVNVEKLKPSIIQDIKGEWVWEPYAGINGLTREGRFYPEESTLPNQRFVVYIAGVNKITDSYEHEYGYVFNSPSLPEVVDQYPLDKSDTVNRNDQIKISLNKSYTSIVTWDIEITPSIDFTLDPDITDQLIITPSDKLDQGEEYAVSIKYKPTISNLETGEIVRQENAVEFLDFSFSVVKEPLIEEFTLKGNSIKPADKLKITFAEEMNIDSVLERIVLTPETAGSWNIVNKKTIEFDNTNDFAKNTQYNLVIKSGATSLNGGVLDKDISYDFKTLGKVSVQSVSPSAGVTGVDEYSAIQLSFNQEVDKESAQSKLSISPSTNGSFSWNGNTMIFTPLNTLDFQTTYTVNLEAGVVSLYGLDSTDPFRSTFTVRADTVVFSIPLYYQPPGFACNIFTAKMVLSWKGADAAYTDLIAEIGYNDTRQGDSWTGNPYAEYVGNADGSYGYGVYYPPIQNIFAARGISSTPHVGWNVTEMASAINSGQPVIIWRYNGVGGGQDISWTASDGSYINAFNGMHGSVISGYTGSVSNPTSFYINDPWLGQFWIDTNTLDYYWSFSGRMALVIH